MVAKASFRGSVSVSVDDVFLEGQLAPGDRGRSTVVGDSSEAKPALWVTSGKARLLYLGPRLLMLSSGSDPSVAQTADPIGDVLAVEKNNGRAPSTPREDPQRAELASVGGLVAPIRSDLQVMRVLRPKEHLWRRAPGEGAAGISARPINIRQQPGLTINFSISLSVCTSERYLGRLAPNRFTSSQYLFTEQFPKLRVLLRSSKQAKRAGPIPPLLNRKLLSEQNSPSFPATALINALLSQLALQPVATVKRREVD